ncbi:MAG: hypothetical protein RRB13_08885 [bacterium]|nr:hypothetical protein [bacterium]
MFEKLKMKGNRAELKEWVKEALTALGGTSAIRPIAQHIWEHHEADLRTSGLLYTWQYDMRWAATVLRNEKVLKSTDKSPKGIWELA